MTSRLHPRRVLDSGGQGTKAAELQPGNAQSERDDQQLDGDGRAESAGGADLGQAATLDQIDHERQTADRDTCGGAGQRDDWLIGMLAAQAPGEAPAGDLYGGDEEDNACREFGESGQVG